MVVGELCPAVIYNVVGVEIVNGIKFFITDEEHDGEPLQVCEMMVEEVL